MRLCFLCVGMMLVMSGHPRADENSSPTPPERVLLNHERAHWSYQPLSLPEVPVVAEPQWNEHPIDRFVRHSMLAAQVEPLPRVGRAALLRRLYFDLTGLPPTPAEMTEYIQDHSPDVVDRIVDRLLASPAYGERFAQHWLDLARYAETDGFEHDLVRPNAWKYRDWVIAALGRDTPYDQFLRLQLAGDEINPEDPDSAVATGFLLCGPDMPDINLKEERRHIVLNEMTATVGSVFLGLQLGCAQCHDHKFDALTQYDFYRMRAFFDSSNIFQDHPIPTDAERAARLRAEAALPDDIRQKLRRREELERIARQRLHEKNPDLQPTYQELLAELSKAERAEHVEISKQFEKDVQLPKFPFGRVMRTGEIHDSNLYKRGDFRQPGPSIQFGFPRVLSRFGDDPSMTTTPRAKLAEWLIRPDHPLVTRVIVNRLWQWHFGVGLCGTPSDFGVMGESPAHPELLDWLARRFTEDGWSFKRMHRLLVTSEAYRIASAPFDHSWSSSAIEAARQTWEESRSRDPNNKRLWHRERHRLDGESLRDALLAASGRLSSHHGGESVRPPLPREVTSTLLKNQWPVSSDGRDHHRRSIYLFVRRNLRFPLLDVFDRPDTNASCPQRHESTTATQALVLLNSEFSLQCAHDLAEELIASHRTDSTQIVAHAYARVFNRFPNDDEILKANAFLRSRTQEPDVGQASVPIENDPVLFEPLVDLCLALLNASEFVYLD